MIHNKIGERTDMLLFRVTCLLNSQPSAKWHNKRKGSPYVSEKLTIWFYHQHTLWGKGLSYVSAWLTPWVSFQRKMLIHTRENITKWEKRLSYITSYYFTEQLTPWFHHQGTMWIHNRMRERTVICNIMLLLRVTYGLISPPVHNMNTYQNERKDCHT